MKTKTKLLFWLICCLSAISSANALEPTFTFTSSADVVKFTIKSTNANCQIDWGDGKKVTQTISGGQIITSPNDVSYIHGREVKVYDDGITYIKITSQKLTALDVSKNTTLQILLCSSNQLKELEVGANVNLQTLECSSNQLNFATLPQAKDAYKKYSYAPQKEMKVVAKYNVVDLSAQVTAIGADSTEHSTAYTWYKADGTLIADTDYTEAAGKFTFAQGAGDNVYCTMTNVAFPQFKDNKILRTVNIKLEAAPTFSFTSSKDTVEFKLKSTNTTCWIDWGDGVLVPHTIDYTSITSPNDASYSANTEVKVYGDGITYIHIYNQNLTALDVSENTALEYLHCSSNQLDTLALGKNTELLYLYCSGNQLIALDVSKNTALEYLQCYSNQLTGLDVSTNENLWYLSCSDNQLDTLAVDTNTALWYLSCSGNQLDTLALGMNTALWYVYCSGNQLTTLDVSTNVNLTELYCERNQLSFATLPQAEITYYTDAPQKNMQVVAKYNVVDLSAQLKAKDKSDVEHTTVYTWYKTDGTLIADTDYTEANGVFTFEESKAFATDSIYCEMTNAAFPYFKNYDILRTVNIKLEIVPVGIDTPETTSTLAIPSGGRSAAHNHPQQQNAYGAHL